jgi:hypothetical protein
MIFRSGGRSGRSTSDTGQVTVAVAILAVGLLTVVTLVYWQGVRLRAGRRAADVAEEAARAGAGQLDRRRAYSGGVYVVDPSAAIAQARTYLKTTGSSGTVTGISGRRIQVSVTVTEPASGLGLIGVTSISVTRGAIADLVTGVVTEGH